MLFALGPRVSGHASSASFTTATPVSALRMIPLCQEPNVKTDTGRPIRVGRRVVYDLGFGFRV